MNKLFFAFKAISVLAGLGSLLFFYLPGMNNLGISYHAAWSLLILSGTIGVASVCAIKINSMLFLRDLDRQVKEHEREVEVRTFNSLLEATEQAHARIRQLKIPVLAN
jgi:hypothetical protein